MDMTIQCVYGRHPTRPSLVLYENSWSSLACVGAGAILNSLEDKSQSKFYFQPPSTSQESPHGSPDPNSHQSKLIRVNRSSCVDASSNLVAVGEDGGYLPRLMLFNFESAACLDVSQDTHQFGVKFLKFSPSGNFLVSMGTPQDGYVYVWNVEKGQLAFHASNRCISEVNDLVWLNNTQFVTVGVRHVRVWTVEEDSLLNGRNVILGWAADLTFECAEPKDDTFLVGTTKGLIISLPDLKQIGSIPEKPINQLLIVNGELAVRTPTQVLLYSKELRTMNIASKTIFAHDHAIYIIPSDSDRPVPFGAVPVAEANEVPQFLSRAHLQVASNPVLCWNDEGGTVLRWPDELIKTSLSCITAADGTQTTCIFGSLSGDVWLDGSCLHAHNGPVTAVGFLNETVAISSGRDRTVQIWAKGESWYLKQTLMFSTPILKAQILQSGEQVSLVCCGANKTVYTHVASSAIDVYNQNVPVFEAAPRTSQLKGMPYDMTIAGSTVAISTNDKLVSFMDPFDSQKAVASWRPVSCNGDSVNLTRILAIDAQHVLGAASNKAVLLFNLQRGECVASQWGHGDQISSLAFANNKVFSASDILIMSELETRETVPATASPPEVPIAKLKLASSPVSRSASPVRKVFDTPSMRPRSSSPIRSPPRSPSPPPRTQTRSPVLRGRPEMSVPSWKQPNLPFKPPRLDEKNSTDNLISALEAFIKSPQTAEGHTPALRSYLLAALQKVDGLAFVDEISNRLCERLDAQITRTLKKD